MKWLTHLWDQVMQFVGISKSVHPTVELPEEDPEPELFKMYPANSYDNIITHVPQGNMELTVDVKLMDGAIDKLKELHDLAVEMNKSQAQVFADNIKRFHRLPPLEAETLSYANVQNLVLSKQPGGNYKIVAADFEDGSSWEHGKVYN